jgi:hypothetical protein
MLMEAHDLNYTELNFPEQLLGIPMHSIRDQAISNPEACIPHKTVSWNLQGRKCRHRCDCDRDKSSQTVVVEVQCLQVKQSRQFRRNASFKLVVPDPPVHSKTLVGQKVFDCNKKKTS